MDAEQQQILLERIQEDERLRGDLEDAAATELVQWALQHAEAVIAAGNRSDAAIEAEVQAIRMAARAAAREAGSAAEVIARAEALLAEQIATLPPAVTAQILPGIATAAAETHLPKQADASALQGVAQVPREAQLPQAGDPAARPAIAPGLPEAQLPPAEPDRTSGAAAEGLTSRAQPGMILPRQSQSRIRRWIRRILGETRDE
ncbi:MAG TPA: hypothetical protein PKA05_19275 [Roseiflexaceae bacterium]|nr:hypothetical protein [Roseiflexaceae bacterium]HMP42529.1 hypothetical protein [Roseiflexaceae bacterium]